VTSCPRPHSAQLWPQFSRAWFAARCSKNSPPITFVLLAQKVSAPPPFFFVTGCATLSSPSSPFLDYSSARFSLAPSLPRLFFPGRALDGSPFRPSLRAIIRCCRAAFWSYLFLTFW